MANEAKPSKDVKPMTPSFAPGAFLDPWVDMRAEMDRMFENFFGGGWPAFSRMRSLGKNGGADIVVPEVDVKENDKEIIIAAELPGIDEKDVELAVQDDVLTLRGTKSEEHEEEKEDYHLKERHYGSFQRSFRLPPSVDQEKIAADFEKGVLKIVLPKKAGAQAAVKRIAVSTKKT
jgi:HSP20 family protein